MPTRTSHSARSPHTLDAEIGDWLLCPKRFLRVDRAARPQGQYQLDQHHGNSQTNRGNRRKAQESCGPPKGSNVSVETKAKVAQNGVKHGLCAKFRVLKEVEKQENYDAFLNQLIEDEQPVGEAEIELVAKMAEHTWLAKRAPRMQNECFELEPKTPEQAKKGDIPVSLDCRQLECYVRYHTAHDRAYQ
ncbi:MAG: hypothetical protein ACRD19_04885, partial [Terriglobia bacterium]